MAANTTSAGRPKYHEEVNIFFQARERKEPREFFEGISDFDGSEREVIVPSCHSMDGICVSVYTPNGLPAKPSIFVFFHGGAFVMGSRRTTEVSCKVLARKVNCIILNAEYRLAPEHKMPAAIDDAVEIMTWVLANKQSLGGSVDSSVGVGGASAGALISADVCHEVPGIDYQILLNGKFDLRIDRPSMIEFKDCPIAPTALMLSLQYEAYGKDYSSVRGVPMSRERFDILPPALFIAAECDPLRDDSYDYEIKLREAGVKTDFLLVKGMIHTYFKYTGVFKETTKLAYDKVATFIHQHS